MNHARLAGSAALIGSAFLWASAYIFVKQLVVDVPPSLLLALRFSAASVILFLIFIPKLHTMNKQLFFAGVRMGIALYFEFFFFTVGMQYTSASKASFLIASYIILLPIAYFIIRRKRPSTGDVLSALVCMAGVSLLLADGLSNFNKGDLLSCFCAGAYAVHVVYSAEYAKKYDGGLLNMVQIGTAAILSWGSTFLFGDIQKMSVAIPVGAIIYLALVCTILPYFLCLFGMKYVSTTTSGILLSFESVFATILAILMLGEPVYWQLVAGGALILGSFFLSELVFSKKKTLQQE